MLEFQDLVGTIQWFSVLQLFELEFRGCLINAVLFTTGTQIEIWTGLVKAMQHTRYGLCVKSISVIDASFARRGVSLIYTAKVNFGQLKADLGIFERGLGWFWGPVGY